MQAPVIEDPIVAIRAAAHRDRTRSQPARIWQSLVSAWLSHLERQVASAAHRLDHDGVRAEIRRASHG